MAKERIKYIDAMRAFTMWLVVGYHVEGYSLHLYEFSIFNDIFITFRMALFFFISGYVGYKALNKWTRSFYCENLLKKAIVQLTPTIVFFTLFYSMNIHGADPIRTFKYTGFGLYWFTYALFVYFVIYYTCALIFRRIGSRIGCDISLIIIALICMAIWFFIPKNGRFWYVLNLPYLCTYFQFFVAGLLVKKYNNRVFKYFSSNALITATLIIFVAGLYLAYNGVFTPGSAAYKFTVYMILKWTGLYIVFCTFVSLEDFFKRDNYLTRAMVFTGRRTLDIYMLHYFFLPQLPQLHPLFANSNNPMLELLIVGSLAVAVIACCLTVSYVIRRSTFLAHYLFGYTIPDRNRTQKE